MRVWRILFVLRAVAALWPLPQHYEEGDSLLRVSRSFSIELLCDLSEVKDLQAAADETLSFLQNDRHQLLVVDRGESLRAAATDAPVLHRLRVSLGGEDPCLVAPTSISKEAVKPLEQRTEAYSLVIQEDGEASLRAHTTLGLFRGLQTFSQLVYVLPRRRRSSEDSSQLFFGADDDVPFVRTPVHIDDHPAFSWRGFHLDTSRNFYRVTTLKKLLRTASMVGFNVWHWHVTDSHSWPLEVSEYPELAEKGSYEGQTYSKAEVDELIAYANARGIDVMLEIDMPGHTGSIGHSHPEHIACFDRQPWSSFAAEPGGPGQIRIASTETTAFVQGLLSSVISTSPSPYFSTGGDEINLNCYAQDTQTQAQLQERGLGIKDALQHFTDKTHETLLRAAKTPVVWEELAIKQKIMLHKDALVMVWTNSKQIRKALKRGLRVILAPADYLYLDCGQGGWLGNPRWWWQRKSWCDFVPWHRVYSLDPYEGLSEDEQPLIIGGEALLWSEQADDTNVEQLLWPRAAAAAEVFWHGGKLGKERDLSEALPRLHDLRYRLVQRGVQAIPLQPHWCALRPGECDAQAAQAWNAFG